MGQTKRSLNMTDHFYDELLNIQTSGNQQGFYDSLHYHRYEPTPYKGLDELFAKVSLSSSDRVVDFGCGKGRLNFYLHYRYQASVVGIEMNEEFYKEALLNKRSYLKKYHHRRPELSFHCCLAEEYEIDIRDTIFYFFNPFSIQIFMKVVGNILDSVGKAYRPVTIILYYSSEDYTDFLTRRTPFQLKEEIEIQGLSQRNLLERFLVYELKY